MIQVVNAVLNEHIVKLLVQIAAKTNTVYYNVAIKRFNNIITHYYMVV